MRHRQASVNGYESKKEWSAVQHVERVGCCVYVAYKIQSIILHTMIQHYQ
jgi:hypothetical protein